MSHREFVHWYALYLLEARERDQARDRAEGKARAQQLSRGLVK
jgi:hypothetical protein